MRKFSWTLAFLLVAGLTSAATLGHDLHERVLEGKAFLKEKDPDIKKFFKSSYGYAVFPKVGKGGFGLGGAFGRGEVFEQGKLVGTAKITNITIGLQLGGQSYVEVVFFKDKQAMAAFKQGKLKMSAQATAVAAASGASADAAYNQGVLIFTAIRGGLMFEATIGGQKFSFKPN